MSYLMITVILSVILSKTTVVVARTHADDLKELARGDGRILAGILTGDLASLRLGIREGGNVDAILDAYLGEKILKLGNAFIDFPVCPAIHFAINLGRNDQLKAASQLLRNGADLNAYKIPSNLTNHLLNRGYPPGIMFGLGFGQIPSNSHAAFLSQLQRRWPESINWTHIDQWRRESGNPPILHIPILAGNFDGTYLLVSEFQFPIATEPMTGLSMKGVSINGVDSRDSKGLTALHVAVWLNDVSTIILLLHNGADRLQKDSRGRIPLHIASMRGFTEAIDLLIMYTAPDSLATPSSSSLKTSRVDITTVINLRQLATKDIYGYTPLALACSGNPRISSALDRLLFHMRLLQVDETVELRWSCRPLPFSEKKKKKGEEDMPIAVDAINIDGAVDSGGWTHMTMEAVQTLNILNRNISQRSTRASDFSLGNSNSESNSNSNSKDSTDNDSYSHHFEHDTLKIDSVDGTTLTKRMFKLRYYTQQRPVVIRKNLAVGNAIWAYWDKEDFLRQYGHLPMSTDRLYYRNLLNRSLLSFGYDRVVIGPTVSDQETQSGGGRSVRDYVRDRMSASELNGPGSEEVQNDEQKGLDRRDTDRLECSVGEPKSSLLYSWAGQHKSNAKILREDVVKPEVFQLCGERDVEPMKVTLAAAAAGVPLHSHNASYNLLVVGAKRWVLFPPQLHELVVKANTNNTAAVEERERAAAHAAEWVVPLLLNSSFTTPKQWFVLYDSLHSVGHPAIAKHSVEFVQYPGDVVFTPAGWMHTTLSLADTVSVSQEFCTVVNTDSRLTPLGLVAYGGDDPHRRLGFYHSHRRTNRELGYDLVSPVGRIPFFEKQGHFEEDE